MQEIVDLAADSQPEPKEELSSRQIDLGRLSEQERSDILDEFPELPAERPAGRSTLSSRLPTTLGAALQLGRSLPYFQR